MRDVSVVSFEGLGRLLEITNEIKALTPHSYCSHVFLIVIATPSRALRIPR